MKTYNAGEIDLWPCATEEEAARRDAEVSELSLLEWLSYGDPPDYGTGYGHRVMRDKPVAATIETMRWLVSTFHFDGVPRKTAEKLANAIVQKLIATKNIEQYNGIVRAVPGWDVGRRAAESDEEKDPTEYGEDEDQDSELEACGLRTPRSTHGMARTADGWVGGESEQDGPTPEEERAWSAEVEREFAKLEAQQEDYAAWERARTADEYWLDMKG